MRYVSAIYQLNSLRLGLVHEHNIYGKPTIFFTIASQLPESKEKIIKYKKLSKENYHCVALPFDHDNGEPGDNYDIIQYYENVLGIDFYFTEKLQPDHIFFQTFGTPENNFTEKHFDNKTNFKGKHNG